jgi:hypothetical protein
MNWRLDISKESVAVDNFDDKIERAISGWADIPGITTETAHKLIAAGISGAEEFESVELQDLLGAGFSQLEAKQVVQRIREFFRR